MTEKKRKQVEGTLAPIFVKKTKLDPLLESTSQVALEAPQLSLEEFALLLDFSSVKEEEEIKSRLDRISRSLLFDFRLAVRRDGKETEFEVLEAEFYLIMEGIHQDPFTHGSDEQKFSGRWYFHRAPRRSDDSHRSMTSKTAYRDGSRKGMDLTFGAPLQASVSKYFSSKQPSTLNAQTADSAGNSGIRGGILLRSLRQLGPNGKITSGPSLLVDQILGTSGSPSIQDLVEKKWEGNISAFLFDEGSTATCLYLKEVKPEDRKAKTKMYFSPRIGLDLSHPGTTGSTIQPLHPRIRFITKRYRFFVLPDKLVANGRSQTFLGILQSILTSNPSFEEALKKSSLSGEIASVMGLKVATASKYLSEFKAGREAGLGVVDAVIGPKGKGASSSPATYLKMMGGLSTI